MDTTTTDRLCTIFPRLSSTHFTLTSPPDARYNCIAWAAGDDQRWWEPDPMRVAYWPERAPRKYTVDAYTEAFRTVGYEVCNNTQDGSTSESIALFAKDGSPTHAARQLNGQIWTSKLGREVDISHELVGLTGDCYGEVARCMHKV